MKSQIFKQIVPIKIIQEILDKICETEQNDKNKYILNIDAFKKGMFLNFIVPFLNELKPYYFDSKKKYVEKTNITYNSFTTVLRQLCHINNIEYSSEIKYEKSTYSIVYKIKI